MRGMAAITATATTMRNHYNNGYNSSGYHANNYNHGYNSSGYHANNYSHNTNVSGNTVNVNNANRQNASADRSDASASSRGWGAAAEAVADRRPSVALEIIPAARVAAAAGADRSASSRGWGSRGGGGGWGGGGRSFGGGGFRWWRFPEVSRRYFDTRSLLICSRKLSRQR